MQTINNIGIGAMPTYPLIPPGPQFSIPALRCTLNLNQIEGFEPVQEFRDDSNNCWKLVKAASNSTIDIPDPKAMQPIDCWCHPFPGLQTEVYIYVVEGIKQPRVPTEQPTRILYQWFSQVKPRDFNPSMITDMEWLKANVYAAPVISDRLSKLNALCHIPPGVIPAQQNTLIQVEELRNNGINKGNTKASQRRDNASRADVSVSKASGNANVPD